MKLSTVQLERKLHLINNALGTRREVVINFQAVPDKKKYVVEMTYEFMNDLDALAGRGSSPSATELRHILSDICVDCYDFDRTENLIEFSERLAKKLSERG